MRRLLTRGRENRTLVADEIFNTEGRAGALTSGLNSWSSNLTIIDNEMRQSGEAGLFEQPRTCALSRKLSRGIMQATQTLAHL